MFENEVLARLDRIEAALSQIRSGPFAGQTPGDFATPGPVDEADVAAALEMIGDLGSFDTETFVRGYLSRGYRPGEIVAAINQTLAPFMGQASAPGTPYPDNPRAAAAYLVTISHGSGGWKQVINHLKGKKDNPIVSPDPLPNLLKGISTAYGPADFVPLVEEVVRRAGLGIDWTGQRRLAGADLEEAKAILADQSRWRPEWRGWQDDELRVVALLTNDIPRKWEGPDLLSGPYPLPPTHPITTVAEWLWQNWKQSRPWAAQDEEV